MNKPFTIWFRCESEARYHAHIIGAVPFRVVRAHFRLPMKPDQHALNEHRKVVARRAIFDNPLSRVDDSVKRGASGWVVDHDECSSLLFVDFGNGAIACEYSDVR